MTCRGPLCSCPRGRAARAGSDSASGSHQCTAPQPHKTMRYHRFLVNLSLNIPNDVSDGTGPWPQRCCRKPLRRQRPSQTGERRQDAGGKAARREDRVEVPPSLPVLPPHITFHPLRPHTRTRAYPRARAHIRAPVHTEGDTRSRARSHTHTHPRPHRNPHTHTHTHTHRRTRWRIVGAG